MTRSLLSRATVLGFVSLAGLAASGCGPYQALLPTTTLPAPTSSHAPVPLRVGVARADITPPPGVSLFGHGPEGRVADGYWSRLYCRVFVFLPDQATPLAVVTCDLSAIGTLLQRSVAAESEVQNLGIPASRLMLTATHTHQAPAHYFEGDFYGSFMSSRAPGYDVNMVRFLSTRIAAAIQRAADGAKPAELSMKHTTAWGISRNRSLVPFLENQPAFVPPADCAADAPPPGLLAEQRAVDPCLDVLTIRALGADGRARGPLGSLSFFAMHPTVMPNTTRLLNADVDGVVSRVVERSMRREWLALGEAEAVTHDPVHAIVNTNEGDVSPSWMTATPDEAVAIGEKLAARIVDASAHGAPVPSIVDSRYVEVKLPEAKLLSDSSRALCKSATLGVAMPKGASDHPTGLTLIGAFRDENVDFGSDRDCEKPRKPFLDTIQRSAAGKGAFPDVVPLALVQLGDTLISFVPAEMTITAGQRLNRAVLAVATAKGLGASRALVGGLANGYIQYVTTEEEYRLQHYEGASELYGIWTAHFLEERYAALARAMAGEDVSTVFDTPVDRVALRYFWHSEERERLPTGKGEKRLDELEGRGPLFLCRLPGEKDRVCFSWKDGAPGVVPPSNRDIPNLPWLRLVDAKTSGLLRTPDDPRGFIDDRGLAFQTHAIVRNGDGYEWATVVDFALMGVTVKDTVKVRAGDGATAIASESFVPSSLTTCNPWQVVRCGTGR